ncbi:MAG TPA: CHAT domain-containing protein [Longimicrobium sp.]
MQAVAACLVTGGVGVALFDRPRAGTASETSLYAALEALGPLRTLTVRTSVDVAYRPCGGSPLPFASEIIRPRCAGPERAPDAGRRIRREAARRMAAGFDPDAIHASALLEVQLRPEPATLVRSIALLHSLLDAPGDSVAVMVDLSAEYLLLGAGEPSLEAVLHSLEWSDRALDARPRDPAALFNRALALTALGADGQAGAAWRAYLAVDRWSGWSAEASDYLSALAPPPPAVVPGAGASAGALAAFARRYPQEALASGWEEVLPAWGRAVMGGDTATAAERLRRAAALGQALALQGGDRSLFDQVRLIRGLAADAPELLAVAADADRYGRAREASRTASFARPDSLYAAIVPRAAHAPLDLWTDVGRAASRLNLGDSLTAERFLDRAAVGAEAHRYLSLAARAWWVRGTLLQRVGRPGEAPRAYVAAESLYARLGERANRGIMQSMVYDALHSAGNPSAGYPWLYRAAHTLRSFGFTAGRHSAMNGLAQAAWGERLPRAARDLTEEDVAVATAMGIPAFVTEARTNRALLRARLGDAQGALRELAEVAPLLVRCDTATRRFLEAAAAYARGMALLDHQPRAAAGEFEKLLAFSGRAQELWRTRGFAGRARARLAGGDVRGGSADLDRVFAALKRARMRKAGAWPREVDGDVRATLLRLVAALAGRGEMRTALAYLERGSAALASFPLPVSHGVLPVPPGRVVLRPLLVGDTLFLWTLRGSEVNLARTGVAPSELAAVGRAAAALRGGADTQAWAELARLYDLLIRPVERQVAAADEVVVVADAELAVVPFPALLNRQTRAPLVAAHPVWRAPSVAAAMRPAGASQPPGRGTFVAPGFSRALNPALEDLPAARSEVAEVSQGYRATVLAGAAAAPAAMETALQNAPLVHFAGHAVSDNLHPERSYLVMSPGPGAPDGRLAAVRIESLDLSRLQLAVLSACSTLGGDSRAAGFAGISGAILGAGGRGVVGTLWPVDDRATRHLTRAFHRAYLRTGNAPRALREAQLEMMAPGGALPASPATWAAFEYVGS